MKLIKVDTHDNLAELNSKLLNSVRFEYLMDKIMVCKALPTQPKAAAIKQALVYTWCMHALHWTGEGYATKAYFIVFTAA